VLIVERLKEEDIPAVVEIENLSFPVPKGALVFKSDQNKYWVAKEDGKAVGYVGVEKIAGEFHIVNTAVHPDYRRTGIARRLLEEILNDKGVFFLEVRVSNLPAQKLYHKYGFEKVGIRKNYYSDNGEDAYIMRRKV
jgi:ribosomal-protein-alanine N-acetyltransferase